MESPSADLRDFGDRAGKQCRDPVWGDPPGRVAKGDFGCRCNLRQSREDLQNRVLCYRPVKGTVEGCGQIDPDLHFGRQFADQQRKLLDRFFWSTTHIALVVRRRCGHHEGNMPGTGLERPLGLTVGRNQHLDIKICVSGAVRENFGRVGHLRNRAGTDKGARLHSPDACCIEAIDEFELLLGRNKVLDRLETVTRSDLDNLDFTHCHLSTPLCCNCAIFPAS